MSLKTVLTALAVSLALTLAQTEGVRAQTLSPEVRAAMQAARVGDPDAMTELGRRYLNGVGVKQDESQALEWFRRAAELEQAEAIYQLGFMYETGIRVRKNKLTAVEYYERAAELGHRGARTVLRRMAPDHAA